MNSFNIRITTIDHIFSFFMIFIPFLYLFKGLGSMVSLGELLLAVPTLILGIHDVITQKPIVISRPLLLFYSVILITSLIASTQIYFLWFKAGTVIIRLCFYAMVVVIARTHFKLDYVMPVYSFAVLVFSLYLVAQYFFFVSGHGYLPIYLKYSWQFPPEARPESLPELFQWGYRPPSLFLEPGYYCLFVIPNLILLIFYKTSDHKKIFKISIICIAILLSGSSAGIIALVLVFSVYVVLHFSGQSFLSLLIKFLGTPMLITGSYLFFKFNSSGADTIQRLSDGGSFGQRVLRGEMVYSALPFFHKIFGLGVNNIGSYMTQNGLSTPYDESNLNYMASIPEILNVSGALGTVALTLVLISILIRLIKERHLSSNSVNIGASVALFLYLIFALGYESILFSYRFAFLFVILEAVMGSGSNISSREPEENGLV